MFVKNTLNKMIDLLSRNETEKFSKELENLCYDYDDLKEKQWCHPDETQNNKVIDNPLLPIPRLEARWREEKNKSMFGFEDCVCDLGIVYQLNKEIRFDVFSTTKVGSGDDIREKLYIPSRMEYEIQALLYQLKLPAFVSYKNNYDEIKFPNSKQYIFQGVREIMEKEDYNKLDD